MTFFHPPALIEEIKKRPGLYKTDTPADREEKLALWKEVGAALYHDWDTFNKATAYDKVLQLQRKWRSLRDAYNRELRARKTGVRVNRRVYRYFKKMSFLGGFTGSISEDDDNVVDDDDGEEETPIPQAVKTKKPRKKRHRKPSSDGIAEPEELEMPTFPVEIAEEGDSDSDRLFLLSFLPEMKQLPVNIKMWVRVQIANVMQEAVSSHYNNTQPGVSGNKNGKKERHDSTD
ncbi:uncharacterized protein LOC113516540 [Galleria mellonella]|uniref:Uncharacterized protein LOC113516540 n=1 Tax=Galleria mellonella TaxID=7137 RepID=A0ABM3MYN0_GALME|nr:uncharacterized protein LOC113516540 [Galleria mellonella]